MSQAPTSLLKELQNGYFFILSLYALRGRGSSPLGNITTFRLGGEGSNKRQINYSGCRQEKDDIRRQNQKEKVLKKESL